MYAMSDAGTTGMATTEMATMSDPFHYIPDIPEELAPLDEESLKNNQLKMNWAAFTSNSGCAPIKFLRFPLKFPEISFKISFEISWGLI